MNWLWLLSYFLGGAFAANAIPHFVAGTMGRPFQSPFAKPPGEGLSSSTVNVLWGSFNLAVGYLLVCRVGSFDLRKTQRARPRRGHIDHVGHARPWIRSVSRRTLSRAIRGGARGAPIQRRW